MRVIAGSARGRRLEAPAGLSTRPLTDRIKESLFAILSPRLPDSVFLDLFAGSGSAGIEALSRGAASVVFVELDSEALRCLDRNLERCGLKERSEVLRQDVLKCLPFFSHRQRCFDIIYADPPFTQPELFDRFMGVMAANAAVMGAEGIMILRGPRGMELPERSGPLLRYRREQYGESVLHFYEKEKQEV